VAFLLGTRLRGLRSADFDRKELYNMQNLFQNFESEEIQKIYKEYLQELEKMISFSKKQGDPFVVLIFPCQIFGLEEQKPVQEALTNHLEEKGLPYVDFIKVFSEVPVKERASHFVDRSHFSESGHKIVAEELYELLVEEGLVILE
jgi:lysophospholipase L1-like esterase